jgi:hypothetical protein
VRVREQSLLGCAWKECNRKPDKCPAIACCA